MKQIITICMSIGILFGCAQEKRLVGGPCEGCEAVLEYSGQLNAVDTLPGFSTNLLKLKITGIVLEADKKTPAEGVIVYIYHTNREGIYPSTTEYKGWGRRHGKHRGWVKTGSDGRYTFYTFQPASYPSRNEPAHIHLTVKEPGITPYYLDDYAFKNDPLLTDLHLNKRNNRGGSGVINVSLNEREITKIQRDIILGLNIPNYED